jgi:hypothetical protein
VKRGHWFKIKNIRECEVDIEELPAFMSITGSNELVTCGDTRITKSKPVVKIIYIYTHCNL